MNNILISHEIPKQLFPYHDLINDYPYVLGHLLIENTPHYNKNYSDFYKRKLKNSVFSILDNGLFELTHSVDSDILYTLAYKYKPTHLVLPDALHDKEKTIHNARQFKTKYRGLLECKFIVVVHGKSFDELLECFHIYQEENIGDIIAIPFDLLEGEDYTTIRFKFIDYIIRNNVIYNNTKLHLLGCTNPSEFCLYKNIHKNYIHSLDTSSPIINGWVGNKFTSYGLKQQKPKDKLAENIDIVLNDEQIELICYNVNQFKKYLED